jgi:hypothetical protein
MKTGEKILKYGFIAVILAIGVYKYAEVNPKYSTDKNPYTATVESKNKNFKVYKENNNGEYVLDPSSTLPASGYILNTTRSQCLDGNDNVVNANLSFSNGKISLTSNKTVYCTLYFDVDRPTLTLTTDQGTTGLSTGDVVTVSRSDIPNQNFYVVSTDASETVLLAQYNLLVGDVLDYDSNTDIITYVKTLSSQDAGYGLQSADAKGLDDTNRWIGLVPFSGLNYWHDDTNGDIYSKYGVSANGANNIYDSDYSNIAPSIDYSDPNDIIVNANNYSIAYYVEQYVNTLGVNGSGRLLTTQEVDSLGCDSSNGDCSSGLSWLDNGTTFWIGSTMDEIINGPGVVYAVYYDSGFGGDEYINHYNMGVRPVLVVSTDDIVN